MKKLVLLSLWAIVPTLSLSSESAESMAKSYALNRLGQHAARYTLSKLQPQSQPTISGNHIAALLRYLGLDPLKASYKQREAAKDAEALKHNQLRIKDINIHASYCGHDYPVDAMKKNLANKHAYPDEEIDQALEKFNERVLTKWFGDYDNSCRVLHAWLQQEKANLHKTV